MCIRDRYGLVGAGRTELLETIFGMRTRAAGNVIYNGKVMNFTSPKDAMDHGSVSYTHLVEDILIACVDGLNGFPQAIEAVYPKTEIQQCIIHQIRNSTKFVSYKDIKKLMADLKLVYAAPTEETVLNELELFKDKWDSKYPKIYKSWNCLLYTSRCV